MAGLYFIGQSGTVYKVNGTEYGATITENVSCFDGFNNIFGNSVYETAGTTDVPIVVKETYPRIFDEWLTVDAAGQGNIYFLSLLDAFTSALTQAQLRNSPGLVQDTVYCIDPPNPSASVLDNVADTLSALDLLIGFYTDFLQDTFGITDTLHGAVGMLASSVAKLSGLASTSLVGQSTVRELVSLSAALLLSLPTEVADSVSLSLNVLDSLLLRLGAAEIVALQANLLNRVASNPVLQETLSFLLAQVSGKGISIEDSFTLSALLADLLHGSGILSDALSLADNAQGAMRLIVAVGDVATIIDPPTGETFDPNQLLNILVQEEAIFQVGWLTNNGFWSGWTTNTTTSAVSQYQGWDFNSFAQFYGQYLAASSTQGIVNLQGTADGSNPISAQIQSALTDFGSSYLKRCKAAYIGINANGTLTFSTTTDDNIERVYQLVPDAPGLHTERVNLARGVLSRYWTFTLQGVGVDFRLDDMSILPVLLERRI